MRGALGTRSGGGSTHWKVMEVIQSLDGHHLRAHRWDVSTHQYPRAPTLDSGQTVRDRFINIWSMRMSSGSRCTRPCAGAEGPSLTIDWVHSDSQTYLLVCHQVQVISLEAGEGAK